MSAIKYFLSWLQKKKGQEKRVENPPLKPTENEEVDANSTGFFESVMDNMPTPIFSKNVQGIFIYCNTAFANFFGKNKAEIVGHTVYDINEKDVADVYHKVDMELMQKGGSEVYEEEVKFSDGTLHVITLNRAALKNKAGKVVGLVGVAFDITDYKKAEKRINRLMKIKEAMLNVSQAVIGTLSLHEVFDLIMDEVFQTMDHADLASILILHKDGYLRMGAYKGYGPEKAKDFALKLEESFIWDETNGCITKSVVINDLEDKFVSKLPVMLENMPGLQIRSTISAPIIIDGKLYGLVNIDSRYNRVYDEEDVEVMEYMRGQIANAISKHNLYEETIFLSRHDKLTGIYNRRYFEELLQICIDKALRYHEEFSLVVFDLNGLKEINDQYGHLVGDEFIKGATERIKARMRSSDILGRFGGDEFIALFYDISEADLQKKMEDLHGDFVTNKMYFEGTCINGSFSYGISKFGQDSTNFSVLIKIADERMYEHKRKFKGYAACGEMTS